MEISQSFKRIMIDPKAPPSGSAAAIGGGDKPKPPARPAVVLTQPEGERGGPKGPEPTRYGDWSKKGIVSDF